MAARFKQFQRDADLFPNLKWTESTSVVKREPHKDLYGLILPIEHPFWLSQYPGSLWNCKCGITNTDEPENSAAYHIERYDMPTPPAGLEGNPAVTGQMYSFAHPYFALGYLAYKKLAPIISKWLDNHFKDTPPAFPIYKKLEVSTKKVRVMATRYLKPGDLAKNEEFAKRLISLYEGKYELKIYILPEIKPDSNKSWLRKYLLPKSTPDGKNPDYYINGNLFDLKESSGTLNTLNKLFSKAAHQAGNVILNYDGKLTEGELQRFIVGKMKHYPQMKIVYMVRNNKLTMYNRSEYY